MPAKHIFKGKNFALSGKLSHTHDVIAETIRKLGGEVSHAVNGNTDYLITTEEDVKEKKLKVATALALDTAVLKETFLSECQAAKSLLPLRKFRIKSAEQKRAQDGAASAAAPAKVRRVAKAVKKDLDFEIATDVPVIAKSGRAGSHGVVKQSITKGHVNGSIVWDVELVLNDPSVGKDKYYCMQLVAPKPGVGPSGYYVIYHWGKTGSSGTCTSDGPFDSFQGARPCFLRRFKQKTGNVWGHLGEAFVDVEGKYRVVANDDKKVGEICWQYYLHNEVDGKKIGWYDYDAAAAQNMEKYWRQYHSNEGLAVRIVRSDYFKYEVNFGEMIQKNTRSGTRRVLRRLRPGEKPSMEPPVLIPEKHKAEEKKKKEEEDAEDSSADEEAVEDPGDEEDELEEGEEKEDEEADEEMEDVAKAVPGVEIAAGRAAPRADPSPTAAPGGAREEPRRKVEEAGRAKPAGRESAGHAPAPAANDEAETALAEDAPSEAETVVADLPIRGGGARKA